MVVLGKQISRSEVLDRRTDHQFTGTVRRQAGKK